MSDPRKTPNPDHLGTERTGQIAWPHVDLCRTPSGPRDRQLLAGASLIVLGQDDSHAYVKATQDGYIGFVDIGSICDPTACTHQVCTPAAHAYQHASIKAPNTAILSFGAKLSARSRTDSFIETHLGHVPLANLVECPAPAGDPIVTARLFLGTPYLWGGNTRAGLDCSGLVQIALRTAGHRCPGDSDMQETDLGYALDDGQGFAPGDLLFWKGHVALVTGPETMIHANAFHMRVVEEAIAPAIIRIRQTGGGVVTTHKRLGASD